MPATKVARYLGTQMTIIIIYRTEKKLKKKITVRSVKLVMPYIYIYIYNAYNALYRIYYYFQLTATEEKNAVHVFI